MDAPNLLAAWESATMMNLGPMLNTEEHEELWSAILANREGPNVDNLAKALEKFACDKPEVRRALAHAINRMPAAEAKE